MRILMLNYEYPPLGGGAGMCTSFQAEGMVANNHEVTVLTTWFYDFPEINKRGNLTIIRLKSKRKYIFKSTPVEMISWVDHAIKYIQKNIQKNSFDICLANFAIPGGIVAKYLKNKLKIPFVIESHGQDIPFFFPKQMLKYHLITYFWIKNLVRKSDKLILLSKEMKENADRFTGKKNAQKNIIIPNGCEMNLFKPSNQPKSDIFTILFVGRLVAQKDPLTFLKAIKKLSLTGIVFRVIVYGNGPLRRTMEKYCNKNNLTQVLFKGWVNKNEITNSYQTASLQVISSLDEAMSISALESLSCGQYIISTPVSGNTELILENVNGEFFPKADYNILAKKIEYFYYQKFLNHFKVDPEFLANFRAKYSWDQIVKQYEQMLMEVVSNKSKI